MRFLDYRALKKGYRFLIDRRYKSNMVINNRYLVKKMLGTGSYGTTYLCQDNKAKRQCVLKQMTKSKRKKLIDAQYQQEVKVLKQLNHPGIPGFYEAFSFHHTLFFSMEYLEGRNLEEAIFFDGKTFNERESLLLLEQVVEILDYLHARGIAHGDLRIPNVLLNQSNVYIIDYGLAKSYGHLPKAVIRQSKLLTNDFFDAGDLLLFLLYTTYTKTEKKELPWSEELTLKPLTNHLLKRLLGMEKPYFSTQEVLADVKRAIDEVDG